MRKFDDSFRSGDIRIIAGVDEAGRGPLAGPVIAAAVIFSPEVDIEGINDSKKLSEKRRDELFPLIVEKALCFAYDIVSNKTIDEINILNASLLAMKNASESLKIKPDLVLIDGNKAFNSSLNTKAIIKGDANSFSIAAASIVAKVLRDKIMIDLHDDFPAYNWAKNKGYPTKEHIAAIKAKGATPFHRKSFLRNILGEQYESFR
ncbi:MAG TPA: ribonuclease HII [Ignavibacteriaceae bacterium]|nr:ribonuclease HII [Ignavibacteriaceae bacterium]